MTIRPILPALSVMAVLCANLHAATPISQRAMSFSVTPPIRDLPAHQGTRANFIIPLGRPHITAPSAREVVASAVALSQAVEDTAVQSSAPQPLTPSPNLTFEGLSFDDDLTVFGGGGAPPDTNGDVGPDHYVQMVNTLFRVFDKTTGFPLTPPTALSSLFSSLPGSCASTDDGDPVVLYDPLADRWMLTQFANVFNGPPFFMSIAISQTGDATGSYFVYCFQMPNNKLNDYPKFGVWPDGYYMTDNQFGSIIGPFQGAGVFAFDRAKMLVGDPSATYVYFDLENVDASIGGILPSDLDGPPPPTGTPNYFMYFTATEHGDAQDGLRIFEFVPDYAVPASSTFTERPESPVAVAAFNPIVPEVPQPPGDGTTLDSIPDRLMFRLQYRNFNAYESLVVCHTVNAGTGTAGVRYYQLQRPLPGGAFSVSEQATFSPDSDGRWMGSAAMDSSGNLAVGYSVSGATLHPSIRYAARLASDPPGGLFQGEASLFEGTGSQTGGLNRWGDYSALTVDPADDCTFWYTTEYIPTDGSFNWRTRIGSFNLQGCSAGPRLNLAFDEAIVSGGNDNGFIDPGECLNLNVVIGNLSTNAATGVGATLTTSTPGVTITQAVSAYADFPGDGLSTNITPFQFCVSTNVACGSEISFFLNLTNELGATSVNFVLDVGISTNLATFKFESGLGGVTIDNTGNGLWHLSSGRGGNPAHSKTNSMYYGKGETSSGGGNYNTGSSNSVGFAGTANRGTFRLPPMNLAGVNGTVLMTFNQFLDRETSSPNYDVAKVAASTDGGQSFVTVGGPYLSTSKVAAFRRSKFRQGTINLTPFLNTEVIVRFSFDTVDNLANDFEGWYVDDIVIKAFACASELTGAGQIVSQGTSVSNAKGVFATFNGLDGANLLTQPVLTNGTHTDFRSLAVDTEGNGIQSVAVTATDGAGHIDFEIRDGNTGNLVSSNSLLAFLTAPYQAAAGDVNGSAGQELLVVASGAAGTILAVTDSPTGGLTDSFPVLPSNEVYSAYSVLPVNVDGGGKLEVAIIGARLGRGELVAEVRSGTTGALVSSPSLRSLNQPFSALAAELDGTPRQQIAVLAQRSGRNALALVDGLTGKTRTKTVLQKAVANQLAVAARVLPSGGKQVVLVGTTDSGELVMEVYTGKGKRIRSFALSTQVTGPVQAIAADVSGDGRDEIIVASRRATDGKPILIALDANTGGSLYLANLFGSDTVTSVRVFAADVDGDGTADVVASANRTPDGRALFEVRAGVSGLLFSAFDQGNNFTGPNAAYGARVGD